MRPIIPVLLLTMLACGGAARIPPAPLGVQGHLAEATRHEQDARQQEELAAAAELRAAAAPVICGDRALADAATSGGERLSPWAPCWTSEAKEVERHRHAAVRLHGDAAEHRARAWSLLAALSTCAELPATEIDHSPFEHRDDIAAVAAELDSDRLRGARVRFKRVPGLTAAWMQRALACHQAWAAARGYDDAFLPQCPAVVAGADTTVLDEAEGIVVVIRTLDPAAALAVYARAEALLDPHGEAGE